MSPKKTVLLQLALLLGCYALLWVSCAKTGVLTGGPEDTQAPRIDSARSTPNFQVRFKKQQIRLTFDEWVELNDVYNQVLISPPLKAGRPEVTLRKKTVQVDFAAEEELRPDATYIINFGEAVRDYTAQNVVEDLRFVFSTGDYIDSLELSGEIIDAFTGKPVEDALMMLYDNLSDTVVRKDIPFYFSKTNEQGIFRLQNIKADTFKTFALLPSDPNYVYDQPAEKIGFVDSFIVLNDSSRLQLSLRIFQENPPLKLPKNKGSKFGYENLTYNQKPYEANIDYENIGQKIVKIVEEDSIKFWYDWNNGESWQMLLQQDTTFDTLIVDTVGRAAFLRNAKLETPAEKITTVGNINPIQGIQMSYNHPLWVIDTAFIYLLEDTTEQRVFPQVNIDSLDSRKLTIQYTWKEELNYQLQILPGALRDLYGLSSDTLELDYLAHSLDDFGTFTINLTELDSSQHYVFQLLKKEQVLEERKVAETKTHQMRFNGLPLGSDYSIRLIEDRLPNGRWDTGSYDEKRQPERLMVLPLQELRANFEAEETIKVKF